MKNLVFVLSFFLFKLQAAHFAYTITEHPYNFSTYYEMHGMERYEGRIIRKSLSVRTCYDLYDASGKHEGVGICRALSLGAFCGWAREIDIYDVNGKKVGFVDGKFWTTASAKYNIYNEQEQLTAIAYLDYSGAGFNVVDSSKSERPLAYLKRNLVDWNVTLYAKDQLDLRILKIFSAFAVHYQDAFKKA